MYQNIHIKENLFTTTWVFTFVDFCSLLSKVIAKISKHVAKIRSKWRNKQSDNHAGGKQALARLVTILFGCKTLNYSPINSILILHWTGKPREHTATECIVVSLDFVFQITVTNLSTCTLSDSSCLSAGWTNVSPEFSAVTLMGVTAPVRLSYILINHNFPST